MYIFMRFLRIIRPPGDPRKVTILREHVSFIRVFTYKSRFAHYAYDSTVFCEHTRFMRIFTYNCTSFCFLRRIIVTTKTVQKSLFIRVFTYKSCFAHEEHIKDQIVENLRIIRIFTHKCNCRCTFPWKSKPTRPPLLGPVGHKKRANYTCFYV